MKQEVKTVLNAIGMILWKKNDEESDGTFCGADKKIDCLTVRLKLTVTLTLTLQLQGEALVGNPGPWHRTAGVILWNPRLYVKYLVDISC